RRYQTVLRLGDGLSRRLDPRSAQNDEYAANYRALGVPAKRIHVTGSVKSDGVCTERHNAKTRELGRLFGIRDNNLVFIAGSTQAPEEEITLDIYRRARERHRNLRLIIVPRQKERFDEVAALLARSGEPFVRRSQLGTTHDSPLTTHVTLVDTIGELGAVWGLADVAFVGGRLDGKRGGQNMIEPAAYGAAVVFGPHVWNFRDTAERLVSGGAAIQVSDANELDVVVRRLLK